MSENYLTVSQLTKYIKAKFDRDPYLEKVYVKGEISNYNSKRQYKHQYFSLKDEHALISAVMFAHNFQKISFELEEGMSVFATGRVSVFEKNGSYQLYLDDLQPDGIGALFLAYEQTKKKLSKEGLFNAEYKKKIPKFPRRIGVITSASGAVLQDIRTTIKRRFPIAEIILFPTTVQGNKAPGEIISSISKLEALDNIDTAIIARGGGSFEDLFCFNDEEVARAIFSMKTPVISSIGHETDTTIADLVADLRAPTPTAAAEQSVPVLKEIILQIQQIENRMHYTLSQKLSQYHQRTDHLKNASVFRQADRIYAPYLQRVDLAEQALVREMRNFNQLNTHQVERLFDALSRSSLKPQIQNLISRTSDMEQMLYKNMSLCIERYQRQLAQSIQNLENLSPLKVLLRGYTMTFADQKTVTTVKQIQTGNKIQVRFHDGIIDATVESVDIKDYRWEKDDD